MSAQDKPKRMEGEDNDAFYFRVSEEAIENRKVQIQRLAILVAKDPKFEEEVTLLLSSILN